MRAQRHVFRASRRALVNLLLLGVVIALAAVAWLEPGRERPAPPQRILRIEPEAVDRMRIEARDAPAVVLERDGAGGWRMLEPIRTPASRTRAELALQAARAVSRSRLDAAGRDLARFGLDPPRAVLALDGARIEFGATEPVSGRRYVRVAEDTRGDLHDDIHLVDDVHLHPLTAPAASFAHPAPLGPAPEVRAVILPDARVFRDGAGWQVAPPRPGLGADALAGFVGAWRDARALRVRDLDPALEPGYRVRVELVGRKGLLSLGVAERDTEVVLTRADLALQYHLTPAAAARLLRLPGPPPGANAPRHPGDRPGRAPAAAGSVPVRAGTAARPRAQPSLSAARSSAASGRRT